METIEIIAYGALILSLLILSIMVVKIIKPNRTNQLSDRSVYNSLRKKNIQTASRFKQLSKRGF